MDGWTDECADRWMHWWMHSWMHWWPAGWMDRKRVVGGLMDVYDRKEMDGCMDRWLTGCIRIDG